jgi:hypothetical protein
MSPPGRLTSIHERVELRSRGFSKSGLQPPNGYEATSIHRAECPSSGTSSSGSRAGLSPIECGGRLPKNFAAKSTSSAQVQGVPTPRKSSNSCETIYLG